MQQIFKGKVKYNFWISMGASKTKFMIACLLAELLVFIGIYFSDEKIDMPVLLFILGIGLIIGYLYNNYYNTLLAAWDKSGYEVLEIDDQKRIISLDKTKIIPFANISQIVFEKCSDSLPRLPKTYDTVNAQMSLHLINNEKIVYYVQTLSVIYKMIDCFNSLNLRVNAEAFDNTLYKLQSRYWYFIFAAIALMIIYIL